MNKVIISGKLGQDPKITYLESGKCKTEFSIAVDRYDSLKKEKFTSWFNITAWEKTAEFAGEHLKKGKNCTVSGYLKEREHNGKMYYNITADEVKFSNAYIELSGTVENLEERFTQNDKKVQTFKLSGTDYTITNTNNKNEVADNSLVNILGTLTIKDTKIFITALKIDCASFDNVKFVEVEASDFISDEEIPF